VNHVAELGEWDSFYVIVGSAAGALIGLQFVVVTLIAERPSLRMMEAGAAFATPTIIHFSAVLFIAALLRVPWSTIAPPAAIWGLLGLCGLLYELAVGRHLRRQEVYEPVFEDWLFHLMLPSAAYALLLPSAFAAIPYTRAVLFAVGASALLLLFVGIHNAWDSVVYHVFVKKDKDTNDKS
jgi:hypothetical protein